ncbi:LysR family transcriptional regulator [Burkholderia sp. SRS-46]|nr:LysR family transcriptional regulator [Burkholderia sp. SRS-46]
MAQHPGLAYFRAFEAVARLGLVRAAASELCITPGAVSQQLRSLQDSLGVELLVKDGRQLRLTEAGKRLQRSVAVALFEIEDCLEQLSGGADSAPIPVLNISLPLALGVSWLAPNLFEFADGTGLSSMNIQSCNDPAQIDWRTTDVAIIYGNAPWPGLAWHLLAGVDIAPVCSPRLLNEATALRSVEELADCWLLHEDDGTEWRRWLGKSKVAKLPMRNARFGSIALALSAALEGKGVALASRWLVRDYLRDGRLVFPFDVTIEASKSYYCLCLETRASEPAIAGFMDWISSRKVMVSAGH